jgi:gliding motility-associated-like protein
MSNLEDIIKQKVEQFEVPFNEAHWNSLEAKLHALKIAKIKKNIFLAAGVVAILSVVGFLTYNPAKTTNTEIVDQPANNLIENNTSITTLDVSTDNTTSMEVNKNNSSTETTLKEKINPVTPKQTTEISTTEQEIKLSNNNEIKEVSPKNISAEFIVYNNRICLGEEVSFEVIEKKNVSYLWDFGDGSTSTKANPKHHYLNDGVYSVHLTVTDVKSGKKVTNEVKNAAEILPLPNADYSYFEVAEKHDANKLKYPYTTFVAKDKSLESYTWNFGNGKTATIANPKIIFDKKGSFKTTLIVKNTYGCVNSITKMVTIDYPFNLFAPNAFSPNQDGDNDTFIPKALLAWDVQFEMLITNKSGDVVFKSTDKYDGWNGKRNNTGADLEPGIYFWQVITYDAEGNPHQHFGKINLIR